MKIKKNDAAIIFKPDGEVEIAIPKMLEEDFVPSHVEVAIAIFAMLDQDDFVNMIDEWWEKAKEKIA